MVVTFSLSEWTEMNCGKAQDIKGRGESLLEIHYQPLWSHFDYISAPGTVLGKVVLYTCWIHVLLSALLWLYSVWSDVQGHPGILVWFFFFQVLKNIISMVLYLSSDVEKTMGPNNFKFLYYQKSWEKELLNKWY